jgi:hypothetical protein
MANFYLDLINGNDANNGTAPATPKKTFGSITPAAGDVVKVKASPTPVMVGGNAMATWNDLAKSIAVTWNTQQVAVIDECKTAWTAGAVGYSPGLGTSYKKATQNSTSGVNTSGATGLAAYRAFGAALDLSGFQSVSFWVRVQHPNTAGSSRMSLRLCSDLAGAVVVNTIPIPAITAGNRWTLVTIDTGGNLGNNINSIAFYVDQTITANGNVSFDNILACKNNSNALTLSSLIGKGSAGETYYGIASIENITAQGCTIFLDNQTETLGNAGRGYAAQTAGLNETLALWKREPITLTQAGIGLVSGTAAIFAPGASGTGADRITYEFGYSDLNLSAPDSETWIDGQNGQGNLFQLSRSYITVRGLAGVRFANTYQGTSNARRQTISIAGANNCTNNGVAVASAIFDSEFTIAAANNNGGGVNSGTNSGARFKIAQANNNISTAVVLGSFDIFEPVSSLMLLRNTGQWAIQFTGTQSVIKKAQTSNSASPFIVGTTTVGLNYARDCFAGSTGISNISVAEGLVLQNFNQVANDHRIVSDGCVTTPDATIRNSNSGYSWKTAFSVTYRDQYLPSRISLGRRICKANRTVTITAPMRRDSLNAVGQLMVKGGELAGVPNDVVASLSGAINTWVNVTLQFTPTEDGSIEVFWVTYSTTVANVWIDDVKFSGAATTRELSTLDMSDRGMPVIANANGSTTTYLSLAWNDVQLGETIRATLPLGEAPDAAPTATLYKNGVIVPGATINIASAGGNDYDITTQIAAGWATGDSYKLKASWTVAGDAYSQMIAQGSVRAVPNTIAPDNAKITAIHVDYVRRADLPTDYQQRNVPVTLPAGVATEAKQDAAKTVLDGAATKVDTVHANYARRTGDYATSENVQDVLDALEVLKGAGWTNETLKAIFEAQSTLQQSATEMETDLETIKIKTLTFGSGPAVVYSPVVSIGKIELVHGGDYYQSEGRAIVVPMASGNIMAIRDHIAQLQFVIDDDDVFLMPNVDYELTDDGIVAVVELSAAQTTALGSNTSHTFYFRAILNNGRKNHLIKGSLKVLPGGE